MNLTDIQFIFNRALGHTFSSKKLLSVFIVLLLCGIMVIFFRGLALHTGPWLAMSLSFLPVFLCAGVMLATGIVLIRIYHDEVKQKPLSYWDIVNHSWDVIIGAGYLTIPIILGYLLLWMLLGIFFLLYEIPFIGPFFSVFLAFAPFILNLGAVLLGALSLAMLFFVAPIVALRGLNRIQLTQILSVRLQRDLFLNIFLGTVATLPFLVLFGLLSVAASLTGQVCAACTTTMFTIVQWFFIMVPFTAVLTPAVIFFFNFAAESHVLLQKQSD